MKKITMIVLCLFVTLAASWGQRYWDGLNPFFQPVKTTNYYGSGDANNDGLINSLDVTSAQAMANNPATASFRADVNGDGAITQADVSMIQAAVNGTALPGWWNKLTTRAAREQWVMQMMARDNTNTFAYIGDQYYWICRNYADQTHINFAGYKYDNFHFKYTGEQTIFNLPMYAAGMDGHSISAILVGNNPLNYNDWLFIEPQADVIVDPRPDFTTITLLTYGGGGVLNFSKQADGTWITQVLNEQLLLTRPAQLPAFTPYNIFDLWNPLIVPANERLILVEKLDDSLQPNRNMYLADLALDSQSVFTQLRNDVHFSRVLDLNRDTNGTIHMLFQGKDPENGVQPQIYYSILDPAGRTLSGTTSLTALDPSFARDPHAGRIITTTDGKKHAFWLLTQDFVGDFINYACYTNNAWTTPVTMQQIDREQVIYFESPDTLLYTFDAAAGPNNTAAMVWTSYAPEIADTTVRMQLYVNGSWQSPTTVIADVPVRGLDIEYDNNGNLHLIYWVGNRQWDAEPGRGDLLHRVYSNGSWELATPLTEGNQNSCPRLLRTRNGDMYMIWARYLTDHNVPVWSKYVNGSWQTGTQLAVAAGSDAWYPSLQQLPNGELLAAWSSRTQNGVSVEKATLLPPDPPPAGNIAVQYLTYYAQGTSNQLGPTFKIVNTGDTALDLGDITVRYYFTRDTATALNWACDYTVLGTGVVQGSFHSATGTNADTYFELKFTRGAVILGPRGGNTGTIQIRIWRDGYLNFNQTNDYSFNGSMTTFGDNRKITGYLTDELKYGVAP